jgi:hypothetical protein
MTCYLHLDLFFDLTVLPDDTTPISIAAMHAGTKHRKIMNNVVISWLNTHK